MNWNWERNVIRAFLATDVSQARFQGYIFFSSEFFCSQCLVHIVLLNADYYGYSHVLSPKGEMKWKLPADESGAVSYWLPATTILGALPTTRWALRLDEMFVTLSKSLFLVRYDM